MKIIIIAIFMLYSFLAIAMDDEVKNRRKSCSPVRMNTVSVKHKRQNSFGEKVLISLHLKTDEKKDYSTTVAALVTDRRAHEQQAQEKSSEKIISLEQSDSRNLINRAGENNRAKFAKMRVLAYEAIKKITAIDDAAYKQYKSNIKYARYYYVCWMTLEVTKDPALIHVAVNQELKPVQEEFDKKIALLSEVQKK